MKVQQDSLTNANSSLGLLSSSLHEAKQRLEQESLSTLVTTLTNKNATVRDIWVMIPFTSAGRPSKTFSQALLPAFDRNACEDLTGVTVSLALLGEDSETFSYSPKDASPQHLFKSRSNVVEDGLVHYISADQLEWLWDIRAGLGQASANGYAFLAEVHPPTHAMSAAQLLGDLGVGADIIIKTEWPREFLSKKDLDDESKAYPTLRGSFETRAPDGKVVVDLEKAYPYPSDCAKRVEDYFKRAFSKAVYVVLLDEDQNPVILINLNASRPEVDDDRMSEIDFSAVEPPRVVGVGDRLIEDIFTVWPGFTPLGMPGQMIKFSDGTTFAFPVGSQPPVSK